MYLLSSLAEEYQHSSSVFWSVKLYWWQSIHGNVTSLLMHRMEMILPPPFSSHPSPTCLPSLPSGIYIKQSCVSEWQQLLSVLIQTLRIRRNKRRELTRSQKWPKKLSDYQSFVNILFQISPPEQSLYFLYLKGILTRPSQLTWWWVSL